MISSHIDCCHPNWIKSKSYCGRLCDISKYQLVVQRINSRAELVIYVPGCGGRASWLGHQPHQHLPGHSEVTRRLAMLDQVRPVVGLNGGGLCPKEKDWWRSRSSALIRAYGLPNYPGACWSPLNGTPRKSRLCHYVQCSEAVSVLLFGRGWLLSGHWDTRTSRKQLAHSEQTAAPQETLSISSQPSSPAPTNTQRLGLVSSSSLSPPFLFLLPLCSLAGFSVCI